MGVGQLLVFEPIHPGGSVNKDLKLINVRRDREALTVPRGRDCVWHHPGLHTPAKILKVVLSFFVSQGDLRGPVPISPLILECALELVELSLLRRVLFRMFFSVSRRKDGA